MYDGCWFNGYGWFISNKTNTSKRVLKMMMNKTCKICKKSYYTNLDDVICKCHQCKCNEYLGLSNNKRYEKKQ